MLTWCFPARDKRREFPARDKRRELRRCSLAAAAAAAAAVAVAAAVAAAAAAAAAEPLVALLLLLPWFPGHVSSLQGQPGVDDCSGHSTLAKELPGLPGLPGIPRQRRRTKALVWGTGEVAVFTFRELGHAGVCTNGSSCGRVTQADPPKVSYNFLILVPLRAFLTFPTLRTCC